MNFKELRERTKSSGMVKKPLDKATAATMKMTVKNVHTSLDRLAWQLENQVEVDGDMTPSIKMIDALIKDAKTIEKEFKKLLKV
jgi:hypothetical protein